MIFIVLFVAVCFAIFFYFQAVMTGLSRKRWAFLGLMFGPFILPLFTLRKELEIIKLYGRNYSIWKA